MKKTITLFFLLAAFFAKGQVLPSDCTTTDSAVYASYYTDAAALAVERLYWTLSSSDTINVTINPLYIDSILRALLAVHNAVGLQHGDTIKDMHLLCPDSTVGTSFYITVDTSLIWAKNWDQYIVLTGDPAMDTFLVKYKIHTVYPLLGFYVFTTDWYFNLKALIDSMRMIQGVYSTYINGCGGDGSFISYSYDGYYQYLTYHYRWGDCWAGCIYEKIYYYRIYPDCSVEELFFTDIIEPNKLDGINIYPNPLTSSSVLQFNTPQKNAEVVIYDMLGKEMWRKQMDGNKMEIEKGSLESGVYFVKVSTEEKQWVQKIIIE